MHYLVLRILFVASVSASAQPIPSIVSGIYFRDENESNPGCPETVEPRVLNLGNGRRKVILAPNIEFTFKGEETENHSWTANGCNFDSDAMAMLPGTSVDSMTYIFQYRQKCRNTRDNKAKRFLYVFGADDHSQINFEVTNIEPNGQDWKNMDDGQAFTCIWRRQ